MKDAGISNRFRSQTKHKIRGNSLLNASEKSRQQVPQQETPNNEHQTTSAATHYVSTGKMPEFQIAPVLQTMDNLTRFLH
jgi:hypothetical protein